MLMVVLALHYTVYVPVPTQTGRTMPFGCCEVLVLPVMRPTIRSHPDVKHPRSRPFFFCCACSHCRGHSRRRFCLCSCSPSCYFFLQRFILLFFLPPCMLPLCPLSIVVVAHPLDPKPPFGNARSFRHSILADCFVIITRFLHVLALVCKVGLAWAWVDFSWSFEEKLHRVIFTDIEALRAHIPLFWYVGKMHQP